MGPILHHSNTPLLQEMLLEERINTLAAALSDEKVSVGWNAAKELGKVGPAASAALPALSEALRSSDGTMALWARYAVAKITGDVQKHLSALIAAVGGKSEQGRASGNVPARRGAAARR